MSPYRDPKVLVVLVGLAGAGVALILLVNAKAEGSMRTLLTLAIAVLLWVSLMALLRFARRR